MSSGDASAVLEQLAAEELPSRMGVEWSELVFVEKMSKGTGMKIFGVSVAFVFLALAALYESWIFPFAVILVVPMCVVSRSSAWPWPIWMSIFSPRLASSC